MSQYKLVPAQFYGRAITVVCHPSAGGNPLIALANAAILRDQGGLDIKDPPPYVEEQLLRGNVAKTLLLCLEKNVGSGPRNGLEAMRPRLMEIVNSLADDIHLKPVNISCRTFIKSEVVLLFKILCIPLLHAWLVDPEDKDLYDDIQQRSYDGLLELLENLQSLADEAQPLVASGAISTEKAAAYAAQRARIRGFLDASRNQLTSHGLSQLHQELQNRAVAILYANNQFSVIHKYDGDLFVLETDERVLTTLPNVMWRKLTLVEYESFYVTSRFSPTKKQSNIGKANAWWQMKLSAHDKPGDIASMKPGKKKKAKPRRNLAKDIEEKEEAPESATFEHAPPISDSCPPTDKEASKSPTTAENFLKFLMEFKDGSSKYMVPHFEGVVKGMAHTGSFKLYVPFAFIQKHDGNLAMDIQDECPRIHNELLQSVATYLGNFGFDKNLVTLHAELEIVNLPKPKINQKFLQFVSENEMVDDYKLHGDVVENMTTYVGRNMGRGFLNHILDKFEEGKCWKIEGWDATHMEVRNNGTEYVINKDPDEELTCNLGVLNLLHYFGIIYPHFMGKRVKVLPAYFDSLQADFLLLPDPKADSQKWQRFVKLMRSPLALAAPLARSALICNVHRVLSLKLELNPRELIALTKRLGLDWQRDVRALEPFLRVYNYKNDISNSYKLDKWEDCHWHVVKYSRHFIEHVFVYLKKKAMLHDISLVELMVANCLQHHIARSIRTIVYEYGVDGMLSSAWGYYEASDCKTMPLKVVPKESEGSIVDNVTKENEASEEDVIEENLVIRVKSRKLVEHETAWAYAEVGKAYSPSSDSSSQKSIVVGNLDLADFEQFLKNEGFHIESSSDDLRREEYIIVSKIIKPEQRGVNVSAEIAVEGPLSEDYRLILDLLDAWLFM